MRTMCCVLRGAGVKIWEERMGAVIELGDVDCP